MPEAASNKMKAKRVRRNMLSVELEDASSERLALLSRKRNLTKSEVVREAIFTAYQQDKEGEDSSTLDRLFRNLLKIQETQIQIQDRLREIEDKVTDSRKHHTDRFDQVIAFIRESEKAFSPLREDLVNVNKNALVAALYSMAIGVHSPKASEINAWIQARNQGA